ncbi:MAG: chorismate synthase [Bacillota bacterium]|nr:chorismate synthase [Bacillota bacterium]
MRYLTAGESHGPCLTAIIEGMPANVAISRATINENLARRQQGYGRGGRMQIEKDQAEILSGVRHGKTLGSPITLQIKNKDWQNWQQLMSPDFHGEIIDNTDQKEGNGLPKEIDKVVTKPRPGHADLSGAIKYRHGDIRNVLERASARETAIRVAVGSVAKALLEALEIQVVGHVVAIGNITAEKSITNGENLSIKQAQALRDQISSSPVMCLDETKAKEMMAAIDLAKKEGDSIGGIVEVIVLNAPPGLGSYTHWDRKLDAKIAFGLMGIQAIKGVEFGLGFEAAQLFGSQVHDSIFYNQERGFYRKSNGAGGIEGGMSNGEPIIVRAAMKPIPTLYKPLHSVDMQTKEPCLASVERSDVCAVPACSAVAEAVVAWEIAVAILEKFGCDSLTELQNNMQRFYQYLGEL